MGLLRKGRGGQDRGRGGKRCSCLRPGGRPPLCHSHRSRLCVPSEQQDRPPCGHRAPLSRPPAQSVGLVVRAALLQTDGKPGKPRLLPTGGRGGAHEGRTGDRCGSPVCVGSMAQLSPRAPLPSRCLARPSAWRPPGGGGHPRTQRPQPALQLGPSWSSMQGAPGACLPAGRCPHALARVASFLCAPAPLVPGLPDHRGLTKSKCADATPELPHAPPLHPQGLGRGPPASPRHTPSRPPPTTSFSRGGQTASHTAPLGPPCPTRRTLPGTRPTALQCVPRAGVHSTGGQPHTATSGRRAAGPQGRQAWRSHALPRVAAGVRAGVDGRSGQPLEVRPWAARAPRGGQLPGTGAQRQRAGRFREGSGTVGPEGSGCTVSAAAFPKEHPRASGPRLTGALPPPQAGPAGLTSAAQGWGRPESTQ